MTKQQKTYLLQVKAWERTQELSIESCRLNIDYLEKKIINDRRQLAAERRERKAKEKMLSQYRELVKKTKAGFAK